MTKALRLLPFLAGLIWCAPSWAQTGGMPTGRLCSSTFALRATECGVTASQQRLVIITDSTVTGPGETVAGSGANTVLAWCSGTTCRVAGDDTAGSLAENAIDSDDFAANTMQVLFCGENAENGTTFFGPSTGAFGGNGADLSIGSAACDALDNTTEATADAPIFTLVPFKVTGMYCKTDGTLGASETLTFTLRTAAGATVPSVTCALAVGEQECRANIPTTTDIAAGATIAVQATESSNNADDNGWCSVGIALK
jgi:hypothetical protein